MTGAVGDYLIKGVRGEFYFCAKDIFEETYEDYQEPLESDYIHIHDIEDQPDGSVIIDMEMGREALVQFAKIGILKVLGNEAKRIINDSEEIDNNVGC
jgi:hypothetical protein